MQGKITGYEGKIAELQKEIQETKLKSALKVALLSEKVIDIDYLTFKVNEKLKEQRKSLELDENENIKGWDDMLSSLKTQFPSQFENGKGSGKGELIEENKLPKQGEQNKNYTKEEILKKPYSERMAIYNENPEAYKPAMNS